MTFQPHRFILFYFSSPLINRNFFTCCLSLYKLLVTRIFVINQHDWILPNRTFYLHTMFSSPAQLNHTTSHESEASRRRNLCDGPGTELFIDAPSNKLFPVGCASRNSDGGVVLPYKRKDDFCETKCRAGLLPRHGIVRSVVSVARTNASTVVTTAALKNILQK